MTEKQFTISSIFAELEATKSNTYRYYSFWHAFESENEIVKVLRELAMKQLWEIYKSVENVLNNLNEFIEVEG